MNPFSSILLKELDLDEKREQYRIHRHNVSYCRVVHRYQAFLLQSKLIASEPSAASVVSQSDQSARGGAEAHLQADLSEHPVKLKLCGRMTRQCFGKAT
jgi:hypothetical protein